MRHPRAAFPKATAMATNATSNSSTSTCAIGLDPYIEKMIGANVCQLIRRKVIHRQERDDWEQDLRIAVLESIPEFDPDKASWHTYANVVVTRTANKKLRDLGIEHRNVIPMESMKHGTGQSSDLADQSADGPTRAERQLQVQQVLASLDGDARSVATAIAEHGATGARRSLGWTKWRFYAARKTLVAALTAAGCDAL